MVTWCSAVKLSIFTNQLETIERKLKILQPSFPKFELILLNTRKFKQFVFLLKKLSLGPPTNHFRCQKHPRKHKSLKIARNTDQLAHKNYLNGKHYMLKKVFC